jgi:hypothetical protein
MTMFTKLGAEICAPTDGSGNPRGASMSDMQTWMTEAESSLGGSGAVYSASDYASDYGATFDGTGTGAADRQAINAAINACYAAGGGIVDLPPVAKIDSSSNSIVLKGGVNLRGEGRHGTRILGDGSGTLITLGGSTTVDHFRGSISNLKMDSADRGVDISFRVAGWDLVDIYFTGIKYPVRIKGKYDGATVGDTYDAINFHLFRLEMEGLPADGVGIDLIHCGEVYVMHCKTPSPNATGTVGLQIDTAVTSVQTFGNNFTGCAYGLIHRNAYGFPSGNARSLPGEPRENWFGWDRYDSGGVGVQFEAGYDVRFDHCWACGNTVGEGFLFGGGSLVRRVSLINAIVKGNKTYGIRTVNGLSNVDLTIMGGEIVSNGNGTSNTYDNIYIGASNTHFSIYTKSYSTSATGLNNVTRYAISIGASCDNYQIDGDIQACVTGAINDGSSSTATHRSVGSLNGSMKKRWTVNTADAATASAATTTTATPYDDTIPQISEGGEFITLSYQPRDANNRLLIWVDVQYAHSTTTWVTIALHAGGAAIAAKAQYVGNSGAPYATSFMHEMAAGTTSAISFSVRIGGSTGSTLTFNGVGGARNLGGVQFSRLRVMEVAP